MYAIIRKHEIKPARIDAVAGLNGTQSSAVNNDREIGGGIDNTSMACPGELHQRTVSQLSLSWRFFMCGEYERRWRKMRGQGRWPGIFKNISSSRMLAS